MGKKNKLIVVIILLIIAIVIGLIIYNNVNNEYSDKDKIDIIESDDFLWKDFSEGKITIDEYVKNNIYIEYKSNLLNERYKNSPHLNIDTLVSKYINELSDDTIKLYIEYTRMDFLSFKLDNSVSENMVAYYYPSNKKTSFSENHNEEIHTDELVENKRIIQNLDKVYLSSNGNFLLWYTDTSISSVSDDLIKKYADLLEKIVEDYNNYFNLSFKNISDVWSRSTSYNDQVKILNAYNIDPKYLEKAISVYFFDFDLFDGNDNSKINGVYQSCDKSDNKIKKFFDNIIDQNDEYGVVVYPYIKFNSKNCGKNLDAEYETLYHELFHHYQNYIINNDDSRHNVVDNVIGESTANWAASKFAPNALRDTSLNTWVSNYLSYSGDIFTEIADKYDINKIGYALFNILDAYEKNVSDGTRKILSAIHADNGFKYLNDNSTDNERNESLRFLAIKNLNGDYENNNNLPRVKDQLKVKKEFNKDIDYYKDNRDISSAGLDYYVFKNDLKKDYEFVVGTSNDKNIRVYVISYTDGNYIFLNDVIAEGGSQFTVNTNEYSNYDKLYIVVSNINFSENRLYSISVRAVDDKKKINEQKNQIIYSNKINNYKLKATTYVELYGVETVTEINGVVDQVNQKQYIQSNVSVMGVNFVTETYVDLSNGITYTSNPLTGMWDKTQTSSPLVNLEYVFDKLSDGKNVTKISDEHYSIKLDKSAIDSLGNYNEYLKELSSNGEVNVEVYIKDGYIYKLEYDFSNYIDVVDNFKMIIELYDYNKASDVVIPTEVISN